MPDSMSGGCARVGASVGLLCRACLCPPPPPPDDGDSDGRRLPPLGGTPIGPFYSVLVGLSVTEPAPLAIGSYC